MLGKYPNADAVINGALDRSADIGVSLDDIIAYTQAIEDIRKGMDKAKILYVKVGRDTFNSKALLKAARMAKKHGLTSVLQMDIDGRAMTFSGNDGQVLVMPVVGGSREYDVIDISNGEITFADTSLASVKVPATLKGIETAKTTLGAIIPNLNRAEIESLINEGWIKQVDDNVVYSFPKADIVKVKEKAKDPNTYNALEDIENNGLVVPMSPQDVDAVFAESTDDGIRYRSGDTVVSDEINDVESEMEAIKEKAINDGTFMKAPNGKPTNLTERQWLQVRTKNFKTWFGDWEIANLYNLATKAWNDKDLKDKVVVSLSDKAKARFDEILGTDVKQFIITADAVRHIKNKHGQNEEKRGQKNMTPEDIAIIPYLINNFDSMNLNPSEDDKLGRAIEVRKRINGVSVIGTIERGENKEFLVTNFTFVKSDALDAPSETPGLNVRNDSDIAKVKKEIENIKAEAINSSKVVDGNGEPLVVYHGSNAMFTVFDTSRIGSTTGTADGRGFYFTTDREYARGFKTEDGQFFDVFLNIDNPLSYDRKTITKAQLKKILKEADRVEFENEGEHYMLSNYADYGRVGIDGAINEAANLEYDYADNDVELVGSLIGGSGSFDLIMDAVKKITGKSGMIAPKDNGAIHYVVTDPAAIKSATDNVGLFSAENPDIRYRKEAVQNAAVNFLVGEPRLRAIENAVNEEAAKLGVTVTYKTRSEMPKGHENDKGYYNTKTGEVVVCTENAVDINDAIQTILHEAIAHKGLRQLMGDKFDEFINRVYDSLDAETKAKVDDLAQKHYKGNKAVAMEEYMAILAESTDFKKDSLWDKIKSIFEDVINAILGRNDIKIGDNELRYILRASYNNMVNPRGMESVRGWAQDQMMREEYKINQSTPEPVGSIDTVADS